MWVVVGLGNPGAEYAHTRHNIGFMVVETVARRWAIPIRDDGPPLRVRRGSVAGQPVLLAEPQTFMNRSGEALAQHPLEVDDVLVVVYDDIDLPVGQVRIRPRGGAGGHRGVASIIERFGSEFARVRVGVGRPPEGCDAETYVLAPLRPAELGAVRAAVERASDALECVIGHGVAVAMSRFNGRVLPSPE